MEKIYLRKNKELNANKALIEQKLGVKITIDKRIATIEGQTFQEYQAQEMIEAMNIGFSARKALLLADENYLFRKLNIKDFTRRKDMQEVRGRIIGREGKTKRTVEEISDCYLELEDNTLGVIGPADSIDGALTALTNLIKGSKQSNVYNYLESRNRIETSEDLGLRENKDKSIKNKSKK